VTGRRAVHFLQANGFALAAGTVLAAGAALAVRFIATNRSTPPPPRKVIQYTMVKVQQERAPRPLPPPPVAPPKVIEQPQTSRVELKAQDFSAPEAPKAASEPGGGRLSLAAEGEGPGDQFNLVGNPGGRGLLSGGGLGDGSGDGVGEGGGGGSRFGWYYAQVATEIEDAFRKVKRLSAASLRVELRIWTDPSGRISKLQLLRSTGDVEADQAIQSVVGLRLKEPPPPDIPMPMIARLTARRLQ